MIPSKNKLTRGAFKGFKKIHKIIVVILKSLPEWNSVLTLYKRSLILLDIICRGFLPKDIYQETFRRLKGEL